MPERYTYGDLKTALAGMPDDTPLFVDGYEFGYHDMKPPVLKTLTLNVNSGAYFGPHDTVSPGEGDEQVEGLVFERG